MVDKKSALFKHYNCLFYNWKSGFNIFITKLVSTYWCNFRTQNYKVWIVVWGYLPDNTTVQPEKEAVLIQTQRTPIQILKIGTKNKPFNKMKDGHNGIHYLSLRFPTKWIVQNSIWIQILLQALSLRAYNESFISHMFTYLFCHGCTYCHITYIECTRHPPSPTQLRIE